MTFLRQGLPLGSAIIIKIVILAYCKSSLQVVCIMFATWVLLVVYMSVVVVVSLQSLNIFIEWKLLCILKRVHGCNIGDCFFALGLYSDMVLLM
jgi:hypothetical protein